jgi:hypothetical protein
MRHGTLIYASLVAVGELLAVSQLSAQEGNPPSSSYYVGIGSGFTITRIEQSKLWGVNGRFQSCLATGELGCVGYRVHGGMQFVPTVDTITPNIAQLGADLGFMMHPVADPGRWWFVPSVTIGASLLYFFGGSNIETWCYAPTLCETVNSGYNTGLLLAGTGTLGFDLRLTPSTGLYADLRVHIPARLGSAGYGKDPHAAFVAAAFGVLLRR